MEKWYGKTASFSGVGASRAICAKRSMAREAALHQALHGWKLWQLGGHHPRVPDGWPYFRKVVETCRDHQPAGYYQVEFTWNSHETADCLLVGLPILCRLTMLTCLRCLKGYFQAPGCPRSSACCRFRRSFRAASRAGPRTPCLKRVWRPSSRKDQASQWMIWSTKNMDQHSGSWFRESMA